jgi:hypothetical protein
MALKEDLQARMVGWENDVLATIPNVNDVKRYWAEEKYLMVPYIAGLKKGMEDCYAAIKHIWIDKVAKGGDYIVGSAGKADGIWFVNFLQTGSVWDEAKKKMIPSELRISKEYWNKGQLWEGAYLSGIRQGWYEIWAKIFSVAFPGVDWVQNQGFPQ